MNRYILNIFQEPLVKLLNMLMMGDMVVGHGHPSAADADADVRHAVVVVGRGLKYEG